MSKALEKFISPGKLGGLTLSNRLIKAATFESMLDDNFNITQKCIDFHESFAKGGVGMTTLACCAPEADGRMQGHYMYIREEVIPQLKKLADTVHHYGTKLSGQIAHCGGFSRNINLHRKYPVAPSNRFNMTGIAFGLFFTEEMDEDLMQEVIDSFVLSAAIMKISGFDAVEIHFGHGYLLSQFISPLTNKRKDEYGGSIENRMRFPLRVLNAIRKEVGNDFPILGKITMYDDMEGGISREDGIAVAQILDQAGINGIILSAGTSSQNPMLIFHGQSLLKGLLKSETNIILKLGMKLKGPLMFKNYPYKELYFLETAKEIRNMVKCNLIYIGGATQVESLEKIMDLGFDFIQSGRPLIRDPAMINHLKEYGKNYINGCNHCNTCVTLIRDTEGIRCILPEWIPAV
ncbi:NADH:flavin oxidoreductase [Elizabethkingia ursingii]|uniref:NADH:flavin oxidoreductase n=1 Tax=Elizabethkingia ursingii TaxID=1756150 RepID=UPI0020115647|nr:NADH:flavin oxidoreductase [Elizabethkingia ursingii]MCL1668168.1 NADH:flavin oxidoreductase [Elizabethkingia ursingii]